MTKTRECYERHADNCYCPDVDSYVQDKIGHWYRVLEVQAHGWRYRVQCAELHHNSETGAMRFVEYGLPLVMGRSELRLER